MPRFWHKTKYASPVPIIFGNCKAFRWFDGVNEISFRLHFGSLNSAKDNGTGRDGNERQQSIERGTEGENQRSVDKDRAKQIHTHTHTPVKEICEKENGSGWAVITRNTSTKFISLEVNLCVPVQRGNRGVITTNDDNKTNFYAVE